MGKKHDKKGKKKVVLSLAEFNEDAGQVPQDPELAALPTAPKGQDEWEAQGGRPEYNSRGYKERNTSSFKDRGYEDDFDDRDWSRRGPMEEQGGRSSEFGGGGERDWGDMRRGPTDAMGDAAPERDWGDMRRAPVDSSHGGDNTQERDWGVRKGPIEAETVRVIGDDDWGNARRTTVEAEPAQGNPPAEKDWSVRKPIDAEVIGKTQEADWGAARKGPIEPEIGQPEAEKDWTVRKGPIDVEPPKAAQNTDWENVRTGPIEAAAPKPEEDDVDWNRRRGPIEVKASKSEENVQRAVRTIDFSEMRRGSKLQQLADEDTARTTSRRDSLASPNKEQWRRDGQSTNVLNDTAVSQNLPTAESGTNPKERDWGAARRTQPLQDVSRYGRHGTGRGRDQKMSGQDQTTPENNMAQPATVQEEDDWTTVRSAGNRRSLNRRSGGRGERLNRRSGPRQAEGGRVVRPTLVDGSKVATASPVTPVTSSISES